MSVPYLSCHQIERFLGSEENRVHALRGVSLQLHPGTVHAVVGPSGCGKSTLLYILGLLDQPDRGSISIQGNQLVGYDDETLSHLRNERIGFVFQFHFLLQDFTAMENVTIPMRRLNKKTTAEMNDRAAMLLDAVNLGSKLHRPSRHLSGGEQQRVAIARSLANDPMILLADEPTGNLDTANSDLVFDLLKRLVKDHQKTLLLVTHNPAIAEKCDWIHEMRDGLVIASHQRNHT
ncbi:MAG: ABC transporter ATP-binding protein [Verrucomicrobiota bacterium]